MARQEDSPVMLSRAKHLEAQRERPFAAAQGDIVRRLGLMRIGADKSVVGTINRPLQLFQTYKCVEYVGCFTGRK
jgi:hypothetical protein